MKRAIFLDRDGTLCRDLHYSTDPGRLEPLPGVFGALRCLRNSGFELVVITNQSGVARGYFREEDLHAFHRRMEEVFSVEEIPFLDILYCPHHPEGSIPDFTGTCSCRKPEPGLILEAARHHGLDLSRSWMVGNAVSDILSGIRAGCRTLLLTDPGEPPADFSGCDERPDLEAPDWTTACRLILETEEA